jgi:hypothetical protein
MIGLLLVLVIIFLLAGYFMGGDFLEREEEAVGTYQFATDRAKTVVRGEETRVLQQSIDMWMLANPGKKCTIEALRADTRYTVPQPPSGYRFEIDENNKAYLVEEQTNVRGVPLSPGMP